MSNPHEWRIASDHEGFYIEDEYGEEILPPWMNGHVTVSGERTSWRCQTMATAESVLHILVEDALINDEPPDPPGWEGGFAENH